MRAEDVLDLARRDVLAAADDDVVEAALDEEVPALVEPAAVAGREPAVVTIVGLAEVLARDLLAAHPDLAGLARRDLDRRRVADRHLDGAERPADRAEPAAHGRVVAGDRARGGRRGRARTIVELVSVSP